MLISTLCVTVLSLLMLCPSSDSATQKHKTTYQREDKAVPMLTAGIPKSDSVGTARPCQTKLANIRNVYEIAVYPYHRDYSMLHCDGKGIRPNITNKQEINLITQAFDNRPINGTEFGTLPNAYVYFKDSGGNLRQGIVVMAWQYILLDQDMSKLYPLAKQSSQILQRRVGPSSKF